MPKKTATRKTAWQNYRVWADQHNTPYWLRWIWGVTVVLFLLSAWLWWSFASIKPSDVFWDTVNNSLETSGFSKHLSSESGGAKLVQEQRISLSPQKVITAHATVQQSQSGQKTTVKTESIATPTENYSRYDSITAQKGSQKLDFSPIIGQWGKQTAGTKGNGIFAQTIFDIIPFANLSAAQREAVIEGMKNGNVYSIDYTGVKKHRQNGRLIYDFPVSIAPAGYIASLKQIDGLIGLNQLGDLDISRYQGNQAVKVTVSIDARARQLTALSYKGSNQVETFSNYGPGQSVKLPSKTVSQDSLQTKLTAILNSQ